MIKKAVLMVAIWLAWSMWKRGKVDPMAPAAIDVDAAPLPPSAYP